MWRGRDSGGEGEAEVLASCYRRSLEVADELGAETVAFPSISTGIYAYPAAQADAIAVATLRSAPTKVREVVLYAYDDKAYDRLTAAIATS